MTGVTAEIAAKRDQWDAPSAAETQRNASDELMRERLVPRHTGEEGASAPTPVSTYRPSRWLIDAPGGSVGPRGAKSEYLVGSYDDIVTVVTTEWPARTRIVHVPDVGTLTPIAPTTPINHEQKPPPTTAKSICLEAARLVSTDRAATHGDKSINFRNIADLWNGYMQVKMRTTGSSFSAHDVGCMMELFKIGRRFSGSYNPDDYIDAAGYAACTGEIAAQEADAHDQQKGCTPGTS
jgi:hypothetical protein